MKNSCKNSIRPGSRIWLSGSIILLMCYAAYAEQYYWSMGRKRHLTAQPGLVLLQTDGSSVAPLTGFPPAAGPLALPSEYAHLAGRACLVKADDVSIAHLSSDNFSVLPVYSDHDGRYVFPVGEIILKAADVLPRDKLVALLGTHKLTDIRHDYPLPGMTLCAVPAAEITDIFNRANRIHDHPDIVWAYPNLLQPLYRRGIVNDPLFATQWHLTNDGVVAGTEAGADARVAEAWSVTMGTSTIKICIFDDSVEKEHEDLAANYVAGINLEDLSPDPSPRIFSGPNAEMHGTACAGVAVARANNGIGCSGAAPLCSLMGIRWGAADAARTAFGFYWARTNGADIISCSWGTYMDAALYESIQDAALNGRNGRGCVILFAAGNDDALIPVWDPSRHPNVICVTASNSKDQRTAYSSYGSPVSITAPSDDRDRGLPGITTTDNTGVPGYSPDNYCRAGDYTGFGGTSSATPLAAGVAALCLAVETNLTAENVTSLLQETADKIDSSTYPYPNGWNQYLGYGRINAARAVSRATGYTNTPVEKTITFTGGKGRIALNRGLVKLRLFQKEPHPGGFNETALVRVNGAVIAQFIKGHWKWNRKGTRATNKSESGEKLKLGGKPGNYFIMFKARHLILNPPGSNPLFELILESEGRGKLTLTLDHKGRFRQ